MGRCAESKPKASSQWHVTGNLYEDRNNVRVQSRWLRSGQAGDEEVRGKHAGTFTIKAGADYANPRAETGR